MKWHRIDDYLDIHSKEMILQIDKTESGIPLIIKILKDDKDDILTLLKGIDYQKAIVLSTNRTNATRLKLTSSVGFDVLNVYQLKGKLKDNLEPLEEMETIDLSNHEVSESITDEDDQSKYVIDHGIDSDGARHLTIY